MDTCPNGHGKLHIEGNKKVCPVCVYSFVETKKRGNKYVEQVNETIKKLWVKAKIMLDSGEDTPAFIALDKRNYNSGKKYRGINRWLTAGHPDISFITKASIEKKNLKIPDLTDSCMVVAWIIPQLTKKEKLLSEKEQKELKSKKRPFMVTHNVYPASLVDGLPKKSYTEDKDTKLFDTINDFLKSTKIPIIEGGNHPLYDITRNTIIVPRHQQYEKSDDFYRDIFRQLAKATAIKEKLNRDSEKFQANVKYGRENLIAEFASAYMSAQFNIEPDNRVIKELDLWFKALDSDPYLLVSASQQAEKVFDYYFK